MKKCIKCGMVKPLSEFYRASGMRDGHRSDCKSCNLVAKQARYQANPRAEIDRVRAWQLANPERVQAWRRKRRASPEFKRKERAGHLKRKFGITLKQYDELLQNQGGKCAICRRQPKKYSLHVDHDHATGEIRGLLCFRCNNALGDFGDDRRLLEAAITYVDRPSEEELAAIRRRLEGLKRRIA